MSNGSVSVPQNGPAGIYVDSAASLTTKGSLTLQQQSNVTGTGTTGGIRIAGTLKTIEGDLTLIQNGMISASGASGSAYGILIDHGSLSASAGKDLTLIQNGAIYASGASGSAYGILIDHGTLSASVGKDLTLTQNGTISSAQGSAYGIYTNQATLSASVGRDLTLIQNGAISASGQGGSAYGIDIDGSSSGSATLTAAHDINFTQNGAISASGQDGSAYGIDIDGGSSGSAKLTAAHDINFTQNGEILSLQSNAFSIDIDSNANGSISLTAAHDINMTVNGVVNSKGGMGFGLDIFGGDGTLTINAGNNVKLSTFADVDSRSIKGGLLPAYSLGMSLNNAKIHAKNDIVLDQSGNLKAKFGGGFGISIYSSALQAGTTNYSLYAERDILFTQNGEVASSGYLNRAVGVTISNARVVAGRNVTGYQNANIVQNYAALAAAVETNNAEINAGYTDSRALSATKGSIYINQTGNVGSNAPSPNQNDPNYNANQNTFDAGGNVIGTVVNPAPDDLTVPKHLYAIKPYESSNAIGIYVQNSLFRANGDISLNQSGRITDGTGILLKTNEPVDSTDTENSRANSANVTFEAGGASNIVTLRSRTANGVSLSDNTSIDEGLGTQSGTFQVKNATLLIDLGNVGTFNANMSTLNAGGLNAVISAKNVTGGGSFGNRPNSAVNLKGSTGSFGVLTVLQTSSVDLTIDAGNITYTTTNTSFSNPTLPSWSSQVYRGANTAAVTNATKYGIQSDGMITIIASPSSSSKYSNLSWIVGGTVKVTGNATFGNDTTIVASGNLTNMDAVSSPNIYAGIYVANGASLSTSAGKNLTLIQNGLFTAAANANAYGVYVANGGTIGNAGAAGTVTIRQNGAITATGNATGVYVAGTIAQGGNVVIDQIGKISSTGSAHGVNLLSGATINAGTNTVSVNSGNQDIALNGTVTAAALTANAGSNLAISTVLKLSGDFSANAGGDVTVTNSITSDELSVAAGGHVTFANIVTTNSFAASAGGNVTAVNSDNQIKSLGNLTGDTVKIATFNTEPADEVGKTVTLTGDIKANNLYLYSYLGTNKSNEYYGTTYNLVGTMKMSNQAGTLAPKLRYISGNDVTSSGNGYFTVQGQRGKLDANALLNSLGLTVTR